MIALLGVTVWLLLSLSIVLLLRTTHWRSEAQAAWLREIELQDDLEELKRIVSEPARPWPETEMLDVPAGAAARMVQEGWGRPEELAVPGVQAGLGCDPRSGEAYGRCEEAAEGGDPAVVGFPGWSLRHLWRGLGSMDVPRGSSPRARPWG